ncbi:hypothetical protein B484DRAFT_458014 [Ochromonadaceae sp. CCMP2298]|nr:hypothetical protein B484DRAFT_458014 [Ochromonadaceae sp. CCMP2298]
MAAAAAVVASVVLFFWVGEGRSVAVACLAKMRGPEPVPVLNVPVPVLKVPAPVLVPVPVPVEPAGNVGGNGENVDVGEDVEDVENGPKRR